MGGHRINVLFMLCVAILCIAGMAVKSDPGGDRARRLATSTDSLTLFLYDYEVLFSGRVADVSPTTPQRQGIFSTGCSAGTAAPGDFGSVSLCCPAGGVTVDDPDIFMIGFLSGVTYSTWIRFGPSNDEHTLLAWDLLESGEQPVCMSLTIQQDTLVYRLDGSNITGVVCEALDDDHWHHIAVTRLGELVTLYVNGTSVASGSIPSPCVECEHLSAQIADSTGSCSMSQPQAFSAPVPFTGCIDDSRWIEGALSQSAVAELCDGCALRTCASASSSSCFNGGWCLILLILFVLCCLPFLLVGVWYLLHMQATPKTRKTRSSSVWPLAASVAEVTHKDDISDVPPAKLTARKLSLEEPTRRGSLPPLVHMAFAKPVPPIDSIAEEETSVVASIEHPPNDPKLINLDDEVEEIVRGLNAECTCGTGVKLVRLKQGEYMLDGSHKLHLRVLHTTVVVRVGGGWCELSNYLRHHCACRCVHKRQHTKESVRRKALAHLKAFKQKHHVGIARMKTANVRFRHGSINNEVTPAQNFGSEQEPIEGFGESALRLEGHHIEVVEINEVDGSSQPTRILVGNAPTLSDTEAIEV